MAWGRPKPQTASSVISQLLPLILVFAVLAGFAFVGYHIWESAHKVKGTVSERMTKKNLVWTPDGGLKVGVKHKNEEAEVDRTQKYFVNAWNLSGGSEKQQQQKLGKKYK
ncbi:hypothetical protein SLS53_002661 [Cytospora paraplurivora]|uniref:Uncharacterized protein n=1 Tax=Cytospora paraplurivora TaxID=2898453 RepID=A0AAN9YJ15_9PEZI